MKTFRIFATILMVAICAGFTSCNNNDDENNHKGKRIVSGTVTSIDGSNSPYNYNSDFTIEYDAQGRVSKSKGVDVYTNKNETSEFTFEYTYTDDKVTISQRYVESDGTIDTYKTTYYLKDGLIVSDSNGGQYEYDAERRIIKYKGEYDTTEYIWKDGNIVSTNSGNYTDTYTYTDKPFHPLDGYDVPLGDVGILFAQGYYGQCIKNLIERDVIKDGTFIREDVTRKYEFDKDGYVTKCIYLDNKHDAKISMSTQYTWQ